MAAISDQAGKLIQGVFGHLTTGQKTVIGVIAVGSVIVIVLLVSWASRPEFVPLFSNMPPDEAGKVVDWLGENNIQYQLEQGGSRILVPKANVYDARIKLAQEGMPSPRNTGYEVFDQTNLGMSEFVQKLNFRRALEGELARTIEYMDEVERARVHIVIPEQALFRSKEKPTTASVVLKVSRPLKEAQVDGIGHLVASSVEGLTTDNISILDSRGNLLSHKTDSDPMLALSTTQIQLKDGIEKSLTHKVETMLTSLLGTGKSIVRISADLDFSRTEVKQEIYDPEMAAVRSEETNESIQKSNALSNEINPETGAPIPKSSTSGNETNTITNYEISKTLKNTVSQTGGIKRISAAILIDGTYKSVPAEDGKGTTAQYVPRSTEEINQITLAVRNALGYDETRGDDISVINIPFQAEPQEELGRNWFQYIIGNWYPILQKVLFGIAIIFVLIYLKNLLQKTQEATQLVYRKELEGIPRPPRALGALPPGEEERLALPGVDGELPAEIQEANMLQQQIVDYVMEKPEAAARLLRTWLVEG